MQTYKEQQEAKGLIFVPFRCSHMVYFHRIAQAYNPNTIDYYKVAGHWITQEEDQQRKKYERNIKFTMYALTICINFAVGYLTLTYYL